MPSYFLSTIKFVVEFFRFTYEFFSTMHYLMKFNEQFQLLEHFNYILMLIERYIQ